MSRIAKGTRPSRRLLAAVAAVSATAFVLAGCTSGGSGDEDSDGTPSPTPEGEGPKVVRVLAVAGPETDALMAGAKDFQDSTGITASIESVARDVWSPRKVAELIEGAGMYDIVFIGAGDDALWALEKADLVDLSDYVDDDLKADVMYSDLFTRDSGELIGVPQYLNFPMFFYRADLFADPANQADFEAQYGRELAPPSTYQEMHDLAEFFHNPPETYGFCLGGVDWSVFLDDTYFTYGLGGNYGDLETGELTLNSPEQVEALTWIDKLTDFNAPGWETQSFFDCDNLMQQGKVAMYQNWLYAWEVLKGSMGDTIAMAEPVGEKSHLGAMVATIPAAAEHPDYAGEFINWMLSDDYQLAQTAATGNLPVRTSELAKPEFREALDGIDIYEKVVNRLTYNFTTWSGELSSGVAEGIAKVLAGEMSPQEAADWLQNDKFAGRTAIE